MCSIKLNLWGYLNGNRCVVCQIKTKFRIIDIYLINLINLPLNLINLIVLTLIKEALLFLETKLDVVQIC